MLHYVSMLTFFNKSLWFCKECPYLFKVSELALESNIICICTQANNRYWLCSVIKLNETMRLRYEEREWFGGGVGRETRVQVSIDINAHPNLYKYFKINLIFSVSFGVWRILREFDYREWGMILYVTCYLSRNGVNACYKCKTYMHATPRHFA